jgi:peptidoglycan/LPS O-acetylase OafA/YrhL
LLLRERAKDSTVSVRKFYVRRILRIWPLYFFGIGVAIGLAFAMHQRSQAIAFFWYLAFAGNVYCSIFGWPANPMTSLWSISIEEQFYLLWPWAMRRLSKRGLFYCALVFIAAANITLIILGNRHADAEVTVWTNTLVQFEMFAVGILLALKRPTESHRPTIGTILILAGPILWFVACFVFRPKSSLPGLGSGAIGLILGYGLVALGCGAVLRGFSMIGPARMPKWAVYLGKISYGLYVFHVLAIDFGHALFKPVAGPLYWAGSMMTAFLLTVSAAVISYSLLETPFLRLKRRFEIIHTRPI